MMYSSTVTFAASLLALPTLAAASTATPFFSNQCISETVLLSASLACSQTGNSDLVIKFNDFQSPLAKNSTVKKGKAEHGPWTHAPACTKVLSDVGSTLCVYTDATFSNGRGISIFTTPRIAAEFKNLPVFHNAAALDEVNRIEDVWYTRQTPGKGTGMFANRTLKHGNRITTYTPVLLVHKDTSLSTKEREHFLKLAINRLPAATRDAYFSLTTVYGDPRVKTQDVVEANAFEIPVGGVMHMAVYPETSRINHDCAPKSVLRIDSLEPCTNSNLVLNTTWILCTWYTMYMQRGQFARARK